MNKRSIAIIGAVVGAVLILALYGLIVGLWLPAARLRYALSDNVADAFQFREIWDFISANLGNYAMAIVAMIVVAVALVVVGIVVAGVTCGLGLILFPFIDFVSYAVMAHLLGAVALSDATRLRP